MPAWISCDCIQVERIQVKASPTKYLSGSVLFADAKEDKNTVKKCKPCPNLSGSPVMVSW